MQPLAIKFIELLESKQLLSDDVIIELRRQVAESKVKLSPELISQTVGRQRALDQVSSDAISCRTSHRSPGDDIHKWS